jgi:Skp family chaperone for outer membrane proteins
MSKIALCLILLSLISIQQVSAGSIYKCKQADGSTTFSDKPCAGVTNEKLKVQTKTENPEIVKFKQELDALEKDMREEDQQFKQDTEKAFRDLREKHEAEHKDRQERGSASQEQKANSYFFAVDDNVMSQCVPSALSNKEEYLAEYSKRFDGTCEAYDDPAGNIQMTCTKPAKHMVFVTKTELSCKTFRTKIQVIMGIK